jgi:K+-sensing histidine kinase KdpD
MAKSALLEVTATRHTVARGLRIAGELLGLFAASVFLCYVMQRLHQANLSALFLLAVLIIAARHGLWPSVLTSALGFLALNFFFTAPYRSLRVTDEGDIATLIFFLAVAILGGNLASRLRAAIRRRDQALERISNLHNISNSIAGATAGPEILQTLVDHLAATLGAETLVITQAAGQDPRVIAASGETNAPNADAPVRRRRIRGVLGRTRTGTVGRLIRQHSLNTRMPGWQSVAPT